MYSREVMTPGQVTSDGVNGGIVNYLKTLQSRQTLRGVKKCPGCGQMNGNRAAACRNLNCELRKEALERNIKKSIDPIQLITFSETKIYSVRSKEREFAPRNFVQITDKTLLSEETSFIISRNAICFVDTCKYDSNDLNISCKHVKSCSALSKNATEFQVLHEVLWNLNVSLEHKMRLWEMYKEDETFVPPVQCISDSIFVVKCTKSQTFPAGRLHVTALADSSPCKTGTYSCACKKLKIVLSPDNSVILKDDICDHLLLVLAAVLSKNGCLNIYSNFTNELKAYWADENGKFCPRLVTEQSEQVPSWPGLNTFSPVNQKNPIFAERVESLDTTTESNNHDDIFIFDNDLLHTDDLTDFPDNIFKSIITDNTIKGSVPKPYHQLDPNMVSNCCSVNANETNFDHISKNANNNHANCLELELSQSNIELMDQFQLTDHIDLCSDDIILSDSELFQGNELLSGLCTDSLINNYTDMFTVVKAESQPHQKQTTRNSENNCNISKKSSVVDSNTVKRHRKPMFDKLKQTEEQNIATPLSTTSEKLMQVDPGPALTYTTWLEYVIETINMSIDFDAKEPNICHTFNVHEEVFSHFSKSFSASVKRRIPTSTCMVKKGKYKGLIKYSWVFHTPSTIQRIFTTKNIAIEIERKFENSCDGYIPYVKSVSRPTEAKYKKIYPKLSLYVAYIWLDCSNNNHKTGFKINWLPNVFPKSRFGVLTIEFTLGYKHPS